MADALTANYEFVKIEVAPGSTGWGDKINDNMDAIDAEIKTVADELAALETTVAGGWETGDISTSIRATKAGWLLLAGTTIGNASSGAARANADTEALFTLLWSQLNDTTGPLLTSAGAASTRGANAAADYAANKRLTLPDARGRMLAGQDDMNGSAASRLTTAGGGVDGATLGAVGGSQSKTIAKANLPNVTLDISGTTDSVGNHNHTQTGLTLANTGTGEIAAGTNNKYTASVQNTSSDGAHSHNVDGNTEALGSGTALAIMPPTLVVNYFIKL